MIFDNPFHHSRNLTHTTFFYDSNCGVCSKAAENITFCLPDLLIMPLSNMDVAIKNFLNEKILEAETSVLMNAKFYIYSSGFGYAWKSSQKILVRILGSMILNRYIMKYADNVYIRLAKKRRFAKFFILC